MDASCIGEKRESFNYSLFLFERFPGTSEEHIFRIREIVNIQVMQEFNILQQYVRNNGLSEEILNNVSDSDKVNDAEKQSLNYRTMKSLI